MQKSIIREVSFIVVLLYMLNIIFFSIGSGKNNVSFFCGEDVKGTVQIQKDDILSMAVSDIIRQKYKISFQFVGIHILIKVASNILVKLMAIDGDKGNESGGTKRVGTKSDGTKSECAKSGETKCGDTKSMETKACESGDQKGDANKRVLSIDMCNPAVDMAVLQMSNNFVEETVAKVVGGTCAVVECGYLSKVPIWLSYIFLILILKLIYSVLPRSISINNDGNKSNINIAGVREFCI